MSPLVQVVEAWVSPIIRMRKLNAITNALEMQFEDSDDAPARVICGDKVSGWTVCGYDINFRPWGLILFG
jgi:hypothetical protein